MSDEQPKWYDEEKEMSLGWSWAVIVLFSCAIAGYGILTYLLVQDGPRRWDYAILPDTPAQSVYNTKKPENPARAPRQIPELPKATVK